MACVSMSTAVRAVQAWWSRTELRTVQVRWAVRLRSAQFAHSQRMATALLGSTPELASLQPPVAPDALAHKVRAVLDAS